MDLTFPGKAQCKWHMTKRGHSVRMRDDEEGTFSCHEKTLIVYGHGCCCVIFGCQGVSKRERICFCANRRGMISVCGSSNVLVI